MAAAIQNTSAELQQLQTKWSDRFDQAVAAGEWDPDSATRCKAILASTIDTAIADAAEYVSGETRRLFHENPRP